MPPGRRWGGAGYARGGRFRAPAGNAGLHHVEFEPATPRLLDPRQVAAAPEVRYGRPDGPPDVRQFGGYFAFGSPDATLLVSLLPRMIHIRGIPRLTQLVCLLGEEAGREDIGRTLILARLVEVLLIEALRAVPGEAAVPGLLRGLADPRVAAALRQMHGDAERSWTVAELAREAGMSRSAFFERFACTIGVRPMEYLLAWRMAVAKDLLRTGGIALDEVARRVGYGSASTFSTAFSRHVGLPPGRFMRSAGRRVRRRILARPGLQRALHAARRRRLSCRIAGRPLCAENGHVTACRGPLRVHTLRLGGRLRGLLANAVGGNRAGLGS